MASIQLLARCPVAAGEAIYRPRSVQKTVLYQLLSEHVEPFLAQREEHGAALPAFVARELRRFLECGIPAHGFMRVCCPECRFEMALPFSCKGRGFCPSCGGRHMAQTAAHLVDRVLPDVPWRQWVLTLPFPLRYRVAYAPKLQTAILRIFVRCLRARQEREAHALGLADPEWGAITVIQRFGSALQLTPHFHTLGMDGVYTIEAGRRASFHPLPPPTGEEVREIVSEVRRRVIASLRRRGLLSPEHDTWAEADFPGGEESSTADCYAAALRGRPGFGRGGSARSVSRGFDRMGRMKAVSGGFDLHGGVSVPAGARSGVERLVRYIARPPVSDDRLERLPDGRIALELKRPYSDGTTHFVLTPDAFIQRLVALIPRPRTHRVRYHGLLAPASPYRRLVVPGPPPARRPAARGTEDPSDAPRKPLRWVLWTELLKRVFNRIINCTRYRMCGGAGPHHASVPSVAWAGVRAGLRTI